MLPAARGDSSGDKTHQRWLALVGAEPAKTRMFWRSLVLAGARALPCTQEVVGSNPIRSIPRQVQAPLCPAARCGVPGLISFRQCGVGEWVAEPAGHGSQRFTAGLGQRLPHLVIMHMFHTAVLSQLTSTGG